MFCSVMAGKGDQPASTYLKNAILYPMCKEAIE